MEKYIATYADGHRETAWSINKTMARFRLKDFERLHGKIKNLEKFTKNGLKPIFD